MFFFSFDTRRVVNTYLKNGKLTAFLYQQSGSQVNAIHDEGAAVKDELNGLGVPVIADLANTAESCRSYSGRALRLHSPTSNETVENSTKRRSKTTNRSLSHRHAPYTTPITGTRNDKLQNQSMQETTVEDIDIPEDQIVELSRKKFCLLLR